MKILIELDGPQHVRPIEVFGGQKAFEKQYANDRRKEKLALENGYSLIRVWQEDVWEDRKDKCAWELSLEIAIGTIDTPEILYVGNYP